MTVGNFFRIPLLLIASFALSAPLHAASGYVKGTVEMIRVADGTVRPDWAPPRFWFSLNNVSSAGACVTVGGRVLFAAESKEALALVTVASAAGREVSVFYDDAQTLNTACRAVFVTFGNVVPAGF